MLSSSHSSGYGEALTSQPRSTRGGAAGATGGMDLSYVTERIIALWFPSSTTQQSYRQGQRHAAHMLRNKHGDNYMVRLLLIRKHRVYVQSFKSKIYRSQTSLILNNVKSRSVNLIPSFKRCISHVCCFYR